MSHWPVREGMKTIRQIADEIGVSKQAVYKRYKGKLHTVCAPYAHTERSIGAVPEQSQEDSVVAVLQATIDTLQGQLEVKDRQIEKLTEALVAAQKTAAAAQALHAGTIQQQLTAGELEPKLEDQSEKKGWLWRLIKR